SQLQSGTHDSRDSLPLHSSRTPISLYLSLCPSRPVTGLPPLKLPFAVRRLKSLP
ncbi:hypothetical protein Csa_022668, partial [Cucumis sativus]